MATQWYKDFEFRGSTLLLVDVMNDICTDYMGQGFVLTVRQLYYQLVARGHIPNNMKSYKRVTGIVNDARLAGLMDWDAITDRTRAFIKRSRWASGNEILDSVARQFHMDMWEGQSERVFVVVEKQALESVLEGVCRQFDVPLLAAKGYPSGTVLREFAISDLTKACAAGQQPVILHLGDHDPSGIDMSRDLSDRLRMFNDNIDVDFTRVALNMDQIKAQAPPPNPAKTTDSRFRSYRDKYGEDSWELDALKPEYIVELVTNFCNDHINARKWTKRQKEIAGVKVRLAELAETF